MKERNEKMITVKFISVPDCSKSTNGRIFTKAFKDKNELMEFIANTKTLHTVVNGRRMYIYPDKNKSDTSFSNHSLKERIALYNNASTIYLKRNSSENTD